MCVCVCVHVRVCVLVCRLAEVLKTLTCCYHILEVLIKKFPLKAVHWLPVEKLEIYSRKAIASLFRLWRVLCLGH